LRSGFEVHPGSGWVIIQTPLMEYWHFSRGVRSSLRKVRAASRSWRGAVRREKKVLKAGLFICCFS